MLLSEAVEANDLAQWALWRFTHCQWNGHCHTTFQLKGGHSTTELSPPQRNLFRQCLVSGDVMMCSWGVWGTNDTWKRIKLALTIYRDFMKSSFIRFWEERQCKPQTTGALSFASLPSNVISFFVQRTFEWDGRNGFVWRGRCRDWGTIAPQVRLLKKPWFQDKHWSTLGHWIWPRLLRKHFINLLTPRLHVVFC